jgi:SAM-dependent methyltransferase
MITEAQKPRKQKPAVTSRIMHKLVANRDIHRVSYQEFRNKVRDTYGGPQGAFLAVASTLSGHLAAGDRLLRERLFDLRGCRSILDLGSGAGQLAKPVLKYCDPEAELTCCDLSATMLERGRKRLNSTRPRFVACDLVHLPFADASFDCITCGYVLEHLPDARVGLAEMARVMKRGGRMLLLVTEDSFSGAWTSRIWCCRTHNRVDLHDMCQAHGLVWKKELWFSRWHQLMRAGGICVEIEKQ